MTAAGADKTGVGTDRAAWRPLGALLVEDGVIGEAELEAALAEQQATGKRLGEILIAGRFTSRQAIQDALAAQCGVMFEPESGFGTGLRSLLHRRHHERHRSNAPEVEEQREELQDQDELHDEEEQGKAVQAQEEPSEELQHDPAEQEAPDSPPQPEQQEVPLQPVLAAVDGLAVARERRRAHGPPPSVNLLKRVEEPLLRTVGPREPERSDLTGQGGLTRPTRPAVEAGSPVEERLGKIDARLAQIETAFERLEDTLRPRHAPPRAIALAPPEPASMPDAAPAEEPAREHLRFARVSGAYRLEVHAGPAPNVGTSFDGATCVKVGPSPLPGDERLCAYVER